MVQFATYSSPLGPITIGYEGNHIVFIRRCRDQHPHRPSPVSDLANQQLREYFAGTRRYFDLPVLLEGTPFQRAVWHAIAEIPYGEVRTYAQIADAIGMPSACRAVGQAANRNPVWIVIPCHRVVGSRHKLTGYAGGLDLKQALLNLENPHKNNPET